ncbi:MAG TPA: hypothetical protein VFQ53_30320 [Kofleriaceae bacterium]|nr:hypothetical protein [Kofleriaceae bacterium]
MSPRIAPLSQGIFYVVTGLWPIVHLKSFERVSGPKVDKWLVKTTGGLIAAVGTALVIGSFEHRTSRALRILGLASAIALGAADLLYSLKGRVSKVYLADAAAEGAAVATWIATTN